MDGGSNRDTEEGSYVGWAIGLLIVVAAFAAGAAVWFKYHP